VQAILGVMFIIKSDLKRYGALTATLQNNFISSHNQYQKTLNAAYNMLVNYVNPNRDCTLDVQDGGLLYRTMRACANMGKVVVDGMGVAVAEAAIIHAAEDNFMTIPTKSTQSILSNWSLKT
jgi:hypothetical protein